MARVIYALMALPLALFFAFVGGNKALAPLSDLAAHHAWTVWLPVWLGRSVGWSELLCVLGLLVGIRADGRVWGMIAGAALVANQIFAGAVHVAHGETDALPQNAVLIIMALTACLLAGKQGKRERKNG